MAEPFQLQSLDPMTMGMERCTFEAGQLRKLIEVAEEIAVARVKKRIPGWQHKLRMVEEHRERFKSFSEEIAGSTLDGPATVSSPPDFKENNCPVILSCAAAADWKLVVAELLKNGFDVDLISFYYALDGKYCEDLAKTHNRVFHSFPDSQYGSFRKD